MGVNSGAHIIEKSNLSGLIPNYRELQFTTTNLLNVFDPSTMSFDGIGREADEFNPTFSELRFMLC
jgi:hypothetical protein